MKQIGDLVAACIIDAAGGFAVSGGVTSSHPGVVSAVRNAKGDYTVTISEAIDGLDAMPTIVTGNVLATGGEVAYIQASDTTFSLKVFDNAGAAQDQALFFQLRRIGVNGS